MPILAEMERLKRAPGDAPGEIFEFDSDEALYQYAKENVIVRVLFEQEAQKAEYEIPAEEIDSHVNEMIEKHGGKESFYRRYKLTEKDMPRVRKHIELNLRMEKLTDEICKDVAAPTEQELRQYYEEHKKEFFLPRQVRVLHIVKRPPSHDDEEVYEEMLDIRRRALKGENFAELSDKHSDCQDEPGGDLGFLSKGEMVDAFEAVVFSMEPGEISPVFLSQFGYHLAKVTDVREARQQSFPAARQSAIGRVLQLRRNDAVGNAVNMLRDRATIVEAEEEKAGAPC